MMYIIRSDGAQNCTHTIFLGINHLEYGGGGTLGFDWQASTRNHLIRPGGLAKSKFSGAKLAVMVTT